MKNKFIENELWYLSLSGAFQRNKVYSNEIRDSTGNKKENFKRNLKRTIFEIVKEYDSIITDEEHVSNILKIITANKNIILKDGKLTFGTVQKLLNLYLKYKWCTNRLKEKPPHCPVDSIILQKSKSYRNRRWTHLDCKDDYMLYINELRDIALSKNMSLAEWELDVFNRRSEENLI